MTKQLTLLEQEENRQHKINLCKAKAEWRKEMRDKGIPKRQYKWTTLAKIW